MKIVINVLIFLVFFFVSMFFFHKMDFRNSEDMKESSTEISILEKKMDVGDLILDSVFVKEVKIKNVGTRPLVVYDIKTGCGCIEAQFGSKKVFPDSTGTLYLKIRPESLGSYVQRIAISCNVKNAPVMLSVKGWVRE